MRHAVHCIRDHHVMNLRKTELSGRRSIACCCATWRRELQGQDAHAHPRDACLVSVTCGDQCLARSLCSCPFLDDVRFYKGGVSSSNGFLCSLFRQLVAAASCRSCIVTRRRNNVNEIITLYRTCCVHRRDRDGDRVQEDM